jgi:ech hydrogenase subunit A
MVKAGVFLLIKLAPAFGFDINGLMVAVVGGFTFLFCSIIAIAQTNAKRVLAYSTIANLGLITLCAGIGTPDAVWAAIFLLIFHAAAKSLLFCCVGTAEHHIGSRDIEDMDGLFARMPKLALLMVLGMAIMFVAPFGMLVGKWATIVSVVEAKNLLLMLVLAFGSAATFMFWAKWLGKMLAVAQDQDNSAQKGIHASEWGTLALMAVLALGMCIVFPWASSGVITPYLIQFSTQVLGGVNAAWNSVDATIDFNYLLIMCIVVVLLIVVFALRFARPPKGRGNATVYMSGVGINSDTRTYRDSLGGETQATQRNWYLAKWFGDIRLERTGSVLCVVVMAIGFVVSFAVMGGQL